MEAIGHAGTCLGKCINIKHFKIKLQSAQRHKRCLIKNFKTFPTSGILSNEGVVLAAERRNTNKLLDEVDLILWLNF